MELVEHHRRPAHQELPRFQVLQELRLGRLEPTVLQEQLGQQAQGQEVILALVAQPASQESEQAGQLAQLRLMELEGLGCCGCRRPWLQLPEH
jgi:hypothetical protein